MQLRNRTPLPPKLLKGMIFLLLASCKMASTGSTKATVAPCIRVTGKAAKSFYQALEALTYAQKGPSFQKAMEGVLKSYSSLNQDLTKDMLGLPPREAKKLFEMRLLAAETHPQSLDAFQKQYQKVLELSDQQLDQVAPLIILNQVLRNMNQRDLPAMDLAELNLSFLNFSKLNLKGSNFRRTVANFANFEGAKLENIDARAASFLEGTFDHAHAAGAVFAGADLERVSAHFADFARANFNRSNLSFAALPYANINDASFRESILTKANFKEARSVNADFRGANDVDGPKGALFSSDQLDRTLFDQGVKPRFLQD